MKNLLTKNIGTPILIVIILVLPFIFWFNGAHKIGGLVGLYVLFTIPSIIEVVRTAIKDGAWPKIVSGPSITLGKKRISL